ncbi:helix-turn-helix domain-containing protein [Blastococcus montanus]|uniref:helix-turn-helix domain-containing protein n=1 Tax=Blastococcus montanus TaxID=3144973 RepID=UPI00320B6DF7
MAERTPAAPPPHGTIDVSDPRALRALAHPLRGRLMAALRNDGPSTASRLAQRLGESSGSTSYHLRQLAAYGFVEELPDEGNGRDRWWRAPHRSTHFDTAALVDDPAGREAVEEISHRQITLHQRLLAAHATERGELDDDRRAAVSLNDWSLRLSPDAARELADELNAVLARWRDTREDAGQPPVHVLLDLFPLTTYPL